MGKTIVISMGQGTLQTGFPHIVVRLWTVIDSRAEQFIGALPAAPEVIGAYQNWQATYQGLSNRLVLRQSTAALEPRWADELDDGLEMDEGGITNISLPDFDVCSQEMERLVNQWLKSEGWQKVERQMRSHFNPADEIRVIVETNDEILLRLPWHCWQFFDDYPRAEMALSRPEYQRQTTVHARSDRQTVRILAIVGDRRGIDIEPERAALQGLADADVEFLVTPTRQGFDQTLWHPEGWDILFFAGHSRTEQETGRIYINEQPSHNSLTIKQLETALKGAIAHGLKLAIFNSCDGVGLAQALGDLQIPQVIVMREPVPNRVAQEFLRNFLDAFAQRQLPLYPAMRQARQRLQGLEDEFPGASWLPVLCQNPAVEPLTWGQLRGMAPVMPPSPGQGLLSPQSLGPNPYKGLLAFDEMDGDRYFGRSVEIDTLWNRLRDLHQDKAAIRFLPIYGPSGSGKSSLARAGLLPELVKNPLPRQGPVRTVVLVPGNDPLYALALALAKLTTDDPNPAGKAAEFKRVLGQNEAGEFVGLRHIVRGVPNIATSPLVILVDQFEEVYSYEPKGNSSEEKVKREKFVEERDEFIKNLLCATSEPLQLVSVVITCRSDFLGDTQQHPELNQLFSTQGFLVPIMGPRQLAEAIAEPAKQAGYEFDAATVQLLVEQTQGRQGVLPLLQFALRRIWDRLIQGRTPIETLEQIGGVGGALADEAKQLYESLDEEEQKIAPRLFLALVQVENDSEVTRRRAKKSELISHKNDIPLIESLIRRFSDSKIRFLVTSFSEKQGEVIEVTHESLIQNWSQLQGWVAEYREALWQKQKIEQEAETWAQKGENSAYLLQDWPLHEAKEFMQAQKNNQETTLSHFARKFIQESLRRKKQKILKAVLIFIIFPFLGTLLTIHLLILKRVNSVLWNQGCGTDSDVVFLLQYMMLIGQKNNLEQIDLCGEELGSINLTGAELFKASFKGAILDHANLSKTYLEKASFQNAMLFNVDFGEADIKEVNFQGSLLYETNFEGVKNLTEEQLDKALLCKIVPPSNFKIQPERDCDFFED